MKRVGVREFRDKATHYLNGQDVLSIERHGKTIGYYLPVRTSSEEESQAAMHQFRQAVERFLGETGMSEEELSQALDVSRRR